MPICPQFITGCISSLLGKPRSTSGSRISYDGLQEFEEEDFSPSREENLGFKSNQSVKDPEQKHLRKKNSDSYPNQRNAPPYVSNNMKGNYQSKAALNEANIEAKTKKEDLLSHQDPILGQKGSNMTLAPSPLDPIPFDLEPTSPFYNLFFEQLRLHPASILSRNGNLLPLSQGRFEFKIEQLQSSASKGNSIGALIFLVSFKLPMCPMAIYQEAIRSIQPSASSVSEWRNTQILGPNLSAGVLALKKVGVLEARTWEYLKWAGGRTGDRWEVVVSDPKTDGKRTQIPTVKSNTLENGDLSSPRNSDSSKSKNCGVFMLSHTSSTLQVRQFYELDMQSSQLSASIVLRLAKQIQGVVEDVGKAIQAKLERGWTDDI